MSSPQANKDDQSLMIYTMERKLNPTWFSVHNRKKDAYSKICVSQYWDWLIYIDVSAVWESQTHINRMSCAGRLLVWVRDIKVQGTLLPTAARDLRIDMYAPTCWLAADFPPDGTSDQIIGSRLAAQSSYHYGYRHVPQCAVGQLGTTQPVFPRDRVTASTSWYLRASLTERAFPRVVERHFSELAPERLLAARDERVRQIHRNAKVPH